MVYLQNRWSRSWVRSNLKSQCESNILSTHIPFVPCNRPSHSWDMTFSKFDLKIQGQGHGWGQSLKSQCESNILSTQILLIPCQSAIPFLRYDFFKIWPWKSKVKVMGEGNVESHKVGVTSYRLTSLSFHVNRPFHSWDTAFSKFDLEIQGQDPMTMMLHNYRSRQFHRTSNGINPSSGFRDMGSATSGPNAAWFDKFLANGQAHMGQMGK